MEGQEDRYPAFLDFDAESRTLTMTPDVYDGGRTYYFTIVAKEKNSESVKYNYYSTVTVLGDIVCRDTQEKINGEGDCVDKCREDQERDEDGVCQYLPCEDGLERINGEGECVPECQEGEIRDEAGVCVLPPCEAGKERINGEIECIPICPDG